MSNVLDLSNADLKGFEIIPSGWKDAVIYEVTDVAVENDTGKLPVGTPGINIQFKLDGGEHDGRFLWNRYWFAPADYDPQKKRTLDGMFARMLLAAGFSEKEVTSGKFKLENDALVSRELQVNVGQYTYDGEKRNSIKGTRPRGANLEESGALL